MRIILPMLWSCLLAAAEPVVKAPASPPPGSGLLEGIAEAAKTADEALDGGSTIGLIPVGSPAAQKVLPQYFQGFFRDSAVSYPNKIPPSAEKAIARIGELKDSGATHVVALYHESGDESEFVRLIAIGNFSTTALAKLEAAGLGHRGPEGSFEILAFKDAKQLPATSSLPALPLARLALMAGQLAKENDCAVDIIPLRRNDAISAYNEALMEAFAEDGQAPGTATVPRRAGQLGASFPQLISLGASHAMVIAFQNAKGADIVLVLAKGAFTPENQAKAKAELGARNASDNTVTLARFVDGEERGTSESGEKKTEKRFKK